MVVYQCKPEIIGLHIAKNGCQYSRPEKCRNDCNILLSSVDIPELTLILSTKAQKLPSIQRINGGSFKSIMQ